MYNLELCLLFKKVITNSQTIKLKNP